MATLHLGVVDIGYTDGEGSTTTGDVAGYLENQYHVMRSFLEINEAFISDALVNEVTGAIESIAQGRRVPKLDLRPAMGKIEERFRDFLDSGELNRMLPESLQSQAAADGKNIRKKNPNTGKPRTAFVETGLYQASFRAWVT